jgi:uncharacterized membrane protein
MHNLQTFLKTTIIGGIVVLLPLILLIKITWWLVNFLMGQLQPLTELLTATLSISDKYSGLVALLLVVGVCFFVGLMARLKLGSMVWLSLENATLKKVPGYGALKDIVNMFSSPNKQSFSKAVLVCPWGNETYLTGFVTDTCENGYISVFSPTSPNPSTGLVFHLPKERVIDLKETESLAFKTVLSCGVGATPMVMKIPNPAHDLK